MQTRTTDSQTTLRPLRADDLDAAVAIDAAIVGHRRRGYFEARLAAALRRPDEHLQYGVEVDGRLAGIVLGHVLTGEFGARDRAVALEVIDIAPDARGHGIAHWLMHDLERAMRRRGVASLQTEIGWSDSALVDFFAATGFRKGPWHVIECDVGASLEAERRRLAANDEPDDDVGEIDYGAPAANDFAALARDRIRVRTLADGDLDAIVRIDRHVGGTAREDYMRAKLDEALLDSAVRVSLIAEVDGEPAGFVMARIDFGDFGHTEPVAVLDTIGVGPEWARRGVATALMSQLLANLSGLQVERLETRVGRDDFELLRFLYRHGFDASQRIALAKRVN